MHQTVNLSQFRDAFRDMGRSDNFSYEGLEVLFDYLEEYEDSTGCPVELDVVALCGDFCEESWSEVARYYGLEFLSQMEDDEKIDVVREFLQDSTLLCGEWDDPDNGVTFVYQCF